MGVIKKWYIPLLSGILTTLAFGYTRGDRRFRRSRGGRVGCRRLSPPTHQTPVIHNIVSSVASSIMASCFLNSRVICTSMPAPVLVLATGGGAACCQLPGRRWHTACEHVAVVCRGELMVGVKLSAAKVCSLTKVHLTISLCVWRMLCLLPKSSKLSSPSFRCRRSTEKDQVLHGSCFMNQRWHGYAQPAILELSFNSCDLIILVCHSI